MPKLFCVLCIQVPYHTRAFEGNYSNENFWVQTGAGPTPCRLLSLKESWVGALLWNSLPVYLRKSDSLGLFQNEIHRFFFQSGCRTAILQNSEYILSLLLLWQFTDRRLYRVDINKVCLNVKTSVLELSTGKKDRWSWMQNYITIDVL